MKKVRILGIESSCDETSVAVIERSASGKIKILSNIVKSQLNVHENFGGVVQELAARAHADKIDIIAKKAIENSEYAFEYIDKSLKKDSSFVSSVVNEDNFSSIQSHLDKSLFKDKKFVMKTITTS